MRKPSVDSIRENLKDLRRNIRYFSVRSLVGWLGRQPVSKIPRIKNFMMKLLPLFFSKEFSMARKNLPNEFSSREGEILKKMAENQILNLLEIISFEKLMEEYPDYLQIRGRHYLDECVAKKRGIIILSAHYGNWELIGYYLARQNLPLHVIVRPQAISRMTDFMNSFRQKRGIKVLMEKNLAASFRLLKMGKVVGLVSDLNARERGYRVPFFGQEASFYPTPVILGQRTGAAVIPTFIERESNCRQIIRFEKPVEWEEGASINGNVRKYVERFEAAFRRRPDHWVWFHDRYSFSHLGRAK